MYCAGTCDPSFDWPVITSPIFIQLQFKIYWYHLHLNCRKICQETISIWGVPENLRCSFKISKAFLWEGMKQKKRLFRKVRSWKTLFFVFCVDSKLPKTISVSFMKSSLHFTNIPFDMGGAWVDEDNDMLIYSHRVCMIILWRFYCGSFCFDFCQPGPGRNRGWLKCPKKA